jgi:dipeptidyl-peptidase-4
MIKKLVFFLLLSTSALAQKKEIPLNDAVLQQGRKFAPDRINNFQWIPGGSAYSYCSKDWTTLYKSDVASQKEMELAKIADINVVLTTDFGNFFGMEWINDHEIRLNDGVKVYSYDVNSKTGKKILRVEEGAENQSFHATSNQMAYTVANNLFLLKGDGKKVSITKNTDKNIVSGQSIARNEFGISNGIFWSENGTYLAFYQKNEANVHGYPLLDINATPGELVSIKYPMTGQKSEEPRVGIYNIKKNKTVYITPRGAKDDYFSNLTFTPDEKFIVVAEVNRDQNHMWLNVYDAKTGKFVKTLFEETNDKWVEPEHPAYFPNKTSNNFIWISEKSGFDNLYYYDFEGKLIKQLTNHDFVVKDILSTTSDGKKIYYSSTGPNPMNTLVYSVDMEGDSELITREEGTHTFSVSADGIYFYDAFSSGAVPHKAMLWTNNGKMAKPLITSKEKLDDYVIGQTEIGTIKAKDGADLYYRMIKPANFDPTKKYPVMVYVYGGPHAQMVTNSWLNGANLWMHWMANQGYIIFTLDNHGSGERGFAFESQIHRRLGDVEMEDQLLGVDFLKSLSYVDGKRMAVHGWSFGGFMTTSLMLRQPGVFTTGVAGGPVTDWKYYEIMYGERYMDRPEQNKEGYEKASLLNYADKLEGDLLLIHGTIDDVVVMQHNYALVKKFVEAGKQMDFFPYPMHKHNVTGKDRAHLIEKILMYILEKNK